MMNTNGRRCVAMKDVKSATGTVRRCARFEADDDGIEHRGGFAAFSNIGNWNVNAMDVGAGLIVGGLGAGAAKYAFNNFPVLQGLPDIVKKGVPLLGGLAAGAIAFYAQKGSPQAKGHFLGATAMGAVVTTWDALKNQFPALADPVVYNFGGYGILTPDGRVPGQLSAYNAVINDPRPGMADLAAQTLGMVDDDAP